MKPHEIEALEISLLLETKSTERTLSGGIAHDFNKILTGLLGLYPADAE